MTKVPQTLGNEAVDAINALIDASDKFRDWNSFEVQSLVRGPIEKLKNVDARERFVRLGALAAICGLVDETLEYFKKALALPGEPETKHELWVSIANVGLYSRAQEIGEWLLDPKRGFFPKIWQKAVSLGQILGVWSRLPEAMKSYPDLAEVDFSALRKAAEVMQACKLSDREIGSVLDLMGDIQREHGIMFNGKLTSFLKVIRPPEDPAYLYLSIPLALGVDEIHAMNRGLATLVVEKLPDGAFPRGMVATFSKAYPTQVRAAA